MNLADLLEVLGYTDNEHLSVSWLAPGGKFTSAVVFAKEAQKFVDALPDADVWFGVNPTSAALGLDTHRGNATQVTRLSAVFADLDVKPGACESLEQAHAIVDVLAELLGSAPAVIVDSGHGLQPYWPIEPEDGGPLDNDERRGKAAALLRRWGRLVKLVAQNHGADADNVFDLPRVLRVPGTFNRKGAPVPVRAAAGTGGPITVASLGELLEDQGVDERETDTEILTTASPTVSDPEGWGYTDEPCQYAARAIAGWSTDNPQARHPWLLAQATRIAAMHRKGCLTEATHKKAVDALAKRFAEICARPGDARPVKRFEVSECLDRGRANAARMSDAHLDTEIGAHMHLRDMVPQTPATTPASPLPAQTPIPANPAGPVAGQFVAPVPNGVAGPIVPGSTTPSIPAALPVAAPGGPGPAPAAVPTPPTPQPDGDVVTIDQMTDAGNADLLVNKHAETLRYCADMGRWLSWTGSCWELRPDDSEAIMAARQAVHSIRPGDSERLAKHKIRSFAMTKLTAMVGLARRDPAMQVRVDQLDADPYVLNTPAGVVDLRTGNLRGVEPAGWHTKQTGVGYDRNAGAAGWSRFLRDTFGDNVGLIGYVQELAGLAAIGEVRDHVLPFLFGGGANGKSVLLDVFSEVLGDYAITAPATFLLAGRGDKHETEIARLRGARLVVCSELNADSTFDEAKLKMLTGGDKLAGRFMRQDFFTFTPTHTLFLAGNHQPEVPAGGTSFWRRLQMIPFTRTVPVEQRIEGLAQQLVEREGPAILAWIVRGATQVLDRGLSATPPEVAAATGEYSEQEDALKRFLDECCELEAEFAHTKPSTLSLAYANWSRRNGEPAMNAKQLGRQLASRFGIRSTKSHGERVYQTLRLLHDDQWLSSSGQQTGTYVPSDWN